MKNENYLEKIPAKCGQIAWSEENGIVTLKKENTGIMNRIMQLIIKKPKTSYIHLDEMGSFIWLRIDGESDIAKIGESVRGHFGESAEPLYERLCMYIESLVSYGFAIWN